MKKKALIISLSVVGAILLIALIGLAVVFLSGNRFTVARCIVTDSGGLYMVYDDSPVHLSYESNTDYQTGDKLLI